jgi:hypothetical protein
MPCFEQKSNISRMVALCGMEFIASSMLNFVTLNSAIFSLYLNYIRSAKTNRLFVRNCRKTNPDSTRNSDRKYDVIKIRETLELIAQDKLNENQQGNEIHWFSNLKNLHMRYYLIAKQEHCLSPCFSFFKGKGISVSFLSLFDFLLEILSKSS